MLVFINHWLYAIYPVETPNLGVSTESGVSTDSGVPTVRYPIPNLLGYPEYISGFVATMHRSG